MTRNLGVLRGLVLGAIGLAACDDGGTTALPDATPGPDATQVDAGGDPPDAAPPEPVTVTVYEPFGNAALVAAAPVIFHDSTGAVTEETETNVDGVATAFVDPDAMVTVIWENDNRLITIAGVQPGDDLVVVGNTVPSFKGTNLGTMNVVLDSLVVGAISYSVFIGCNSTSGDGVTPMILDVYDYCGSHLDVLALANDGVNGYFQYSFVENALVNPGGDLTLGPWQTDFVDDVVTLANAPTDTNIFVSARVFAGPYRYHENSVNIDSSLGETAGTVQFLGMFGDAYETRVWDFAGEGERFYASRTAAPVTAETVDFATDVLPRVGVPVLTDDVIAWTAEGALVGDDGTYIQLFVNMMNELSFDWVFLAPPGATSLKAPSLPAAWDQFSLGDQVLSSGGDVWVVGADFFDAQGFRERAGNGFPPDLQYDNSDQLLPPVGTISLSTSDNGD